MPDSTLIWTIAIGIISFIWILISRLSNSSETLEDEFQVQGDDDLKDFLKNFKVEDVLKLPGTNGIWSIGFTDKAASVTEDTQLRLMEFRSFQKVDVEYIEALL